MRNDWEDVYYDKIYSSILNTIYERRKIDVAFTKAELNRQFRDICILEGLDYHGRGRVGDLNIEATIAAMQHALAEWE
ncbi:MAG: hypothetical protein FWE37_01635 [Spirochaetaceae bacterium]|nr:hypothetical protein [Spirochaetaceae bacterium]